MGLGPEPGPQAHGGGNPSITTSSPGNSKNCLSNSSNNLGGVGVGVVTFPLTNSENKQRERLAFQKLDVEERKTTETLAKIV